MINKNNHNKDGGFTLIELIVAMSIFIIFMTISIGGFMQILSNQRLSLKLVSATNNMVFPLEQIMREVRVGTNFSPSNTTCSSGNQASSFSFDRTKPDGNTYKITYYYDSAGHTIKRSEALSGNVLADDSITSKNVNIDSFKAIVCNPDNSYLTRVIIDITVSVSDKTNKITKYIQTTASSRIPQT